MVRRAWRGAAIVGRLVPFLRTRGDFHSRPERPVVDAKRVELRDEHPALLAADAIDVDLRGNEPGLDELTLATRTKQRSAIGSNRGRFFDRNCICGPSWRRRIVALRCGVNEAMPGVGREQLL